MSTASLVLKAADGMTPADVVAKMKANMDEAAHDCMIAGAKEARSIIEDEGSHHYIRAGKARKPIRLGAKLGPTSGKVAIVYGIPAGFWAIVESGSKPHRIQPKKKATKKGPRPLLRTPYGPRPFVLHPGHGSLGHPWSQAMTRVGNMPQGIFEPSVIKAFAAIWK